MALTQTREELREELHRVKMRVFICGLDDDYEGIAYYEDRTRALELAIDIRFMLDREAAIPRTGAVRGIDAAEVKNNTPILPIAERYTTLKKAGRLFIGPCPFHQEKHGSFVVYPETNTWHCYGACSTGGDIFALVMKAENTDFKGALAMLTRS